MKNLITGFAKQLEEAIEIGSKARFTKAMIPVQHVLISGLGGSGIGGSIVAELVAKEASVPIVVNKDYFIPAFVGPSTLVIISSYSGNTEETIQSLESAIERKAKIVCISSGGKIKEIAQAAGLDYIQIPSGMPPRACLGYSLTQLFFILAAFGIISHGFKEQLTSAVSLINLNEDSIRQEAKKLAELLHSKTPVIYTTAGCEGIAIRFRQQLNENSKVLGWHHVFPELNHNELVGWRKKNDNLAVIILRNESDYSRTQERIRISKEVFKKYTNTIIELHSKGNSPIENAIYFIHLGDWISYFLAEKGDYDANEIEVINHLKDELSKLD
jgi:glucose/mannose-6-phosphate isomerase